MNKLRGLFGTSTNQEHPLIIAQYERADFTVGNEEELHWVLVVLTNAQELKGPCWQAIAYNYSDERGTRWQLVSVEVGLSDSEKCLGGVRIGSIKPEDLQVMDETVKSNLPVPKFDGWTGRDWVMESLELIKPHGWVKSNITSQGSLITSMKNASQATLTQRETKKKGDAVVVVEFKEGENV